MGANQLARPQFEKKSWGAGGYENPNKPKMAAGGYQAAQDCATIPSGPFRPAAMGPNGNYAPQGRFTPPPARPYIPQSAPQQREERRNPTPDPGNQRSNNAPPLEPPTAQKPPAQQEQPPVKQEPAVQYRTASGAKTGVATEYLSQKIWKVNGNKKVIDFNSKVVRANYTDYANIHGFGGSDHAANSTIGFVICDYTNGKGEGKSVTMKFNVDVEDIAILHQAAIGARMGTLRSPLMETSLKWLNTCIRLVDGWRKNFTILEFFTKILPGAVLPSFMGHEKSRIIPRKALNALMAVMMSAKAEMNTLAGAPVWKILCAA